MGASHKYFRLSAVQPRADEAGRIVAPPRPKNFDVWEVVLGEDGHLSELHGQILKRGWAVGRIEVQPAMTGPEFRIYRHAYKNPWAWGNGYLAYVEIAEGRFRRTTAAHRAVNAHVRTLREAEGAFCRSIPNRAEEVPTTACFDCGTTTPVAEIYLKKADPSFALCGPCFQRWEAAGRAKVGA